MKADKDREQGEEAQRGKSKKRMERAGENGRRAGRDSGPAVEEGGGGGL